MSDGRDKYSNCNQSQNVEDILENTNLQKGWPNRRTVMHPKSVISSATSTEMLTPPVTVLSFVFSLFKDAKIDPSVRAKFF